MSFVMTPKIRNIIGGRINKNITTDDIVRLLGQEGKDSIMEYSDLANVGSILELLPTDKSYKIILIEQQQNLGHWTLIMRYGNTIEYFDSYGLNVDGELKFISACMNRILGQSKHYLTKLIKERPPEFEYVWNSKHLQLLNDYIATCGRWVIVRISMMQMGWNLKEFITFFKEQKKETNLSNDELVSLYVK